MTLWIAALVFGLQIRGSLAVPHPFTRHGNEIVSRQDVGGEPEAPFVVSVLNNTLPYVLPRFDRNSSARAGEITRNRAGFLYGPSLLGNTSYFPTGPLGDALVQEDLAYFALDIAVQHSLVLNESVEILEAFESNQLFESLESYDVIYNGQWKHSLPDGTVPGALTNYTQDLFFSMERLTSNPYVIERLSVSQQLPFVVEDSLVKRLTGLTLTMLHSQGRLFYADHSYQGNSTRYPIGIGKYSPACQAYFYISPGSGEFLPLAIKLEPKSTLIYTPLDDANDWLLAKILFNVNDFFHSQMYHLAASHVVSEIVYEAALRTMSIKHPIRGFMDSLMYQAFAPRVIGTDDLFNTGGTFDQVFSIGSTGAQNAATDFYASTAGAFSANYLSTNFIKRGLIDCSFGPALKHNPYFEDASTILASMRQFLTQYVATYYPNPAWISEDEELQNWVAEANGPAKVLDFPKSISTCDELVDVLTHMAFLSGINHHVLNGNALPSLPAVLPFHPGGIYKPIPTQKKITSQELVAFLPNLTQSVAQAALATNFNRPLFEFENKTLPYMFDSPQFLGNIEGSLVKAAQKFKSEMMLLSKIIGARQFDAKGLSNGSPFVWQFLDPMKLPFFLDI